jgi:hypothetical protein
LSAEVEKVKVTVEKVKTVKAMRYENGPGGDHPDP